MEVGRADHGGCKLDQLRVIVEVMISRPEDPRPKSPLDAEPPRAVLRRLVQALLKSDEDLDAFCMDYFQVVHDRFALGMDRLAKINLLLKLASPNAVLTRLQTIHQNDLSALATISHLLTEPQTEEAKRTKANWEQLDLLCLKKDEIKQRSESTALIDKEIAALKRAQRSDPQVVEGEILQDRYRLIETIGRGGFAKVWKAFDKERQRVVAIKILHIEQSDEPKRVERFKRGACQMQGLNHQHIVRVLDGPGEHKDFHYFVMEYVSGGDLFHAVVNRKLDLTAALLAVLQIGSALEHAHQGDLIHRDVKPQNILIDERGAARLTDFDLVWAPDTTGGTRTGAMGTFLYSAPEQMEDASKVDRRADVYSLGMTTLFVLYGKTLPRRVIDSRALFIDELKCPETTKALLRRATASDPDDRPATVESFCRELADTLQMDSRDKGLEVLARTSGVPVSPRVLNAGRVLRADVPRTIIFGMIAALSIIAIGLGIMVALPSNGIIILTVDSSRSATVYIDGVNRGTIDPNSPLVIRDILRGAHLMRVHSIDGETQQQFKLTSDVLQLKVHLGTADGNAVTDKNDNATQRFAVLRLRLPPDGALVSLNGKLINEKDIEKGYRVPAGVPQEVTIKKAGKRPVTFVEILKPGQELERTIELKEGRGRLTIGTRPLGADIQVNGRSYGKSPVTVEDLDPTKVAKVVAKMQGFGSMLKQVSFGESFEQTLDLDFGTTNGGRPRSGLGPKTATVTESKSTAAPFPSSINEGYLIANSQPYSKVRIDGKNTGKSTPISPREHIPLKPGKHVITFVLGAKKVSAEFTIQSGETAKVVRNLDDYDEKGQRRGLKSPF